MPGTDSERPICPRCGYDQSGVVTTWETACPVSGTCPECGHGFLWADLFVPSRQDLRWYVEHARGPVSFVWRSVRTLVLIAAPRTFWQRMGVDRRVRGWMLTGWIGLVFAAAHTVASMIIALIIAGENGGGGGSLSGIIRLAPRVLKDHGEAVCVNALIWPAAMVQYGWIIVYDAQPEALMMYSTPIGFGAMWVILLVALPTTRRLAKLRFAHVWRAFAIQCGVVAICFETLRVLDYGSQYLWSPYIGVSILICFLFTMLWSVVWWGCGRSSLGHCSCSA